MITIKNLSKGLGVFGLQNVSAEIPDGMICGLVGRNGAGKTSLIHLLLGLYRPDEGSIVIDGMTYPEKEKEIRDRLGIVLDEDTLRPELSLRENGKFYGAYYSGYSDRQYRDHLKEFNLDERKAFGQLSRGQKRKAQFAFALAVNPGYLIMDEPTANFDPDFKEAFLAKVRAFVSNEKNSVLISTHMTEDLENLADYLIDLDGGQVLYAGDMERFRDKYRIVSGEKYKIKLLSPDDILAMEEREYSCRALIRYRGDERISRDLLVTRPTIEEFMYLYSRKNDSGRKPGERRKA